MLVSSIASMFNLFFGWGFRLTKTFQMVCNQERVWKSHMIRIRMPHGFWMNLSEYLRIICSSTLVCISGMLHGFKAWVLSSSWPPWLLRTQKMDSPKLVDFYSNLSLHLRLSFWYQLNITQGERQNQRKWKVLCTKNMLICLEMSFNDKVSIFLESQMNYSDVTLTSLTSRIIQELPFFCGNPETFVSRQTGAFDGGNVDAIFGLNQSQNHPISVCEMTIYHGDCDFFGHCGWQKWYVQRVALTSWHLEAASHPRPMQWVVSADLWQETTRLGQSKTPAHQQLTSDLATLVLFTLGNLRWFSDMWRKGEQGS